MIFFGGKNWLKFFLKTITIFLFENKINLYNFILFIIYYI